ncbi:MAG: 3-hydroxyacyl-CoA dehydrogenase family protein, partial [Solirubrobacterales bacterium]|nr:3-hydroxyacyl-CoA dehydrogenase family protein [Solirubrobacterales bacterium]
GTMGGGITMNFLSAGIPVTMVEREQAPLDRGVATIRKNYENTAAKGRIKPEQVEQAMGLLTPSLNLEDLADCDLVIEAVTENLDTKLDLWKQLDGIVKDEAYFATNTSSLPVINQAAATTRPSNFLGLHFFNPVQRMPLLEVIQSVTTSPEAMGVGLAYGDKLKKTTVETKDKAGFIVNRLLVPYMLDAIRGLEEGIGSIDEIDAAMKAGAAHPMGPLTLADFVGLDTLHSIADVMFDEFRERRFAAPPTLRKMVAAGFFGVKSGRGFYDYSGEKPVPVNPGL